MCVVKCLTYILEDLTTEYINLNHNPFKIVYKIETKSFKYYFEYP